MKSWWGFLWCYVRRFSMAVLIFLSALSVGLTTIWTLDRLGISRPNIKSFAPYSSSLLVMVIVISLVLILCIPGGPSALSALLRRIKSIGPMELFPAEDPDEEEITSEALRGELQLTPPAKVLPKFREALRKALKFLSSEQRKILMRKLSELRERKKRILCLHAGRVAAAIERRGVRLETNDLFFDAEMRRGDNQILVRLVSASSKDSTGIAREAKEVIDAVEMTSSGSHPLFIHLVFYSCPNEEFKRPDSEIENIRKTLFNVCSIRLFFYAVTTDNSVIPVEDIP